MDPKLKQLLDDWCIKYFKKIPDDTSTAYANLVYAINDLMEEWKKG